MEQSGPPQRPSLPRQKPIIFRSIEPLPASHGRIDSAQSQQLHWYLCHNDLLAIAEGLQNQDGAYLWRWYLIHQGGNEFREDLNQRFGRHIVNVTSDDGREWILYELGLDFAAKLDKDFKQDLYETYMRVVHKKEHGKVPDAEPANAPLPRDNYFTITDLMAVVDSTQKNMHVMSVMQVQMHQRLQNVEHLSEQHSHELHHLKQELTNRGSLHDLFTIRDFLRTYCDMDMAEDDPKLSILGTKAAKKWRNDMKKDPQTIPTTIKGRYRQVGHYPWFFLKDFLTTEKYYPPPQTRFA